MKIFALPDNYNFIEAFSSKTRIKIIEMLNQKPMKIKDIAENLGVSSTIVTKHINKLEDAGIIKCESMAGIRGMQKVCSINLDQVVIQFRYKTPANNSYSYTMPIGQYSGFTINPTCGLSSTSKLIGVVDDPRYFADPEHVNANMLWFGSGFVEYRLPNYILSNQTLKSISISLEICSEAPFYNEDWPSDITFFINEQKVGMWTSPGDFGKNVGIFTPGWWTYGTSHGLLKTILINQTGSFIDGIKMSDLVISNLNITYGSEIMFRIGVLEDAANIGGICILGKGFGNYDHDINITLQY